MERYVEVQPAGRLWAEDFGTPDRSTLLLIMGANAPGVIWPRSFVATLSQRHHVIRYDHRDTGRSTWAFDEHPYAITDLAQDAIAVLDAFDIQRAHVVGMSMGGILAQLLLLDHPDRLLSATLLCTCALGDGLAGDASVDTGLPGPDPALLEFWKRMGDERDRAAEVAWRVEHWRRLNGDKLLFDPGEFRRLEENSIVHAGRVAHPTAHARAAQGGLDRGDELAEVRTPTLVVQAAEDPVNPPPHGAHLAKKLAGARLVTVPSMGHALNRAILPTLGEVILEHTAAAE